MKKRLGTKRVKDVEDVYGDKKAKVDSELVGKQTLYRESLKDKNLMDHNYVRLPYLKKVKQ